MIKVYDTPVSGNCHKARLMLSLLGLDYELAPINLLNKEHKTPNIWVCTPWVKFRH